MLLEPGAHLIGQVVELKRGKGATRPARVRLNVTSVQVGKVERAVDAKVTTPAEQVPSDINEELLRRKVGAGVVLGAILFGPAGVIFGYDLTAGGEIISALHEQVLDGQLLAGKFLEVRFESRFVIEAGAPTPQKGDK